MDDKTKERIKKLQALAERGIGGEKITAEKKLNELLAKCGIRSLQELETDETRYYLFSYNGKHKAKLLRQCMYKVIGAAQIPTFYRSRGTRQKIGIYCTAAQKIEIELEYEFYSNIFDAEIEDFMSAFITKQGIYPIDAPHSKICEDDLTPEELEKLVKKEAYASGITKRTRQKMIDQK